MDLSGMGVPPVDRVAWASRPWTEWHGRPAHGGACRTALHGRDAAGRPCHPQSIFLHGRGTLARSAVNGLDADARAAELELAASRSEEHTSELQSRENLVC